VTRDLEDKLSQAYRTTVILSAAMIASVFVYAGLVELLPRLAPSSAAAAEAATVELLRKVFRGLALVNFLALAWLVNRAGRPVGEPLLRLSKLKTLTTVGLALAESIALYGLVLFFLSRDPIDFYYLLLVSLLSFIVVFPRHDRWREALNEMPARS
jgi:F0F1-type ATP synthase membrane subunit c/vacuolar-type H+-ATPase subunit K